jgi:glycosyltransferase involved in cell wall biosynthesis
MHPDTHDRVSIVIPGRNASRTLDACLQSIVAHVPADRYEVIVVDHASTDRTGELARSRGARVVRMDGGFVSGARNLGAREARHEILAFVDSDCTVEPGWYDAVVSAFGDPSIGVAGARHELPNDSTWCERVWRAAHVSPAAGIQSEVPYVPAGNLAVRKSTFDMRGGFDESLETGEDPDFCARVAAAGLKVVQDRRMRCVHLGEPKTLWQVFRRERWHGRGARFRYGDGRFAPVTLSTFAFAALLAAALVGVGIASAIGRVWPLWLLLAPWVVPAVYALRKVRRLDRPVQIVELWVVYWAYFLGRTAALPIVIRRLLLA